MKEVRERAVIPFTTNTKMPLFGNKKANKTEKLGDRYLAATFRERGLLGIVLADHERGAMVQNYQEDKREIPFAPCACDQTTISHVLELDFSRMWATCLDAPPPSYSQTPKSF